MRQSHCFVCSRVLCLFLDRRQKCHLRAGKLPYWECLCINIFQPLLVHLCQNVLIKALPFRNVTCYGLIRNSHLVYACLGSQTRHSNAINQSFASSHRTKATRVWLWFRTTNLLVCSTFGLKNPQVKVKLLCITTPSTPVIQSEWTERKRGRKLVLSFTDS